MNHPAAEPQTERDVLVVDDSEGIRVLTMNRPEVRNAVNGALARALDQALTSADDDPAIRVTVLTGTGPTFCAGADLKAISKEGDQILIKGKGFAGIARRERKKPLICAVNGAAMGGGFEICLAADLLTASETATFALSEVLRSRIAGGGGLLRVGRTLPTAVAMEIGLTGRPIKAERAYQLGLINAVTAPGHELGAALELARAIVKGAPLSVAASKRIIDAAQTKDEEEVWAITTEEFRRIRASADSIEGTTAFVEKREPRWTGY